jgi:hypothetical protein
VSFNEVEFTMARYEDTRPQLARSALEPRTEVLDLILTAASGVFPGPVLEALIARLEVTR